MRCLWDVMGDGSGGCVARRDFVHATEIFLVRATSGKNTSKVAIWKRKQPRRVIYMLLWPSKE